jgi:hypothetical protein
VQHLPFFQSATPGTQDVSVSNNQTRTLAAGSYRTLSLKEGGKVVFSGGIYHFNAIEAKGKTTLAFAGPSDVRVQTTVEFGEQSIVGPASTTSYSGADIVFYVSGSTRKNDALLIGGKSTVAATFYVPFGSVNMKEKAIYRGAIIAEDVTIGEGCSLTLSSYFLAHPEGSGGGVHDASGAEFLAGSDVPTSFALEQNYPNPFNPATEIRYQLPEQSEVRLSVFNMLGQEVRTLVQGSQMPGTYVVRWDGTNNNGLSVSSGIYLYKISAGRHAVSKKMIFLK